MNAPRKILKVDADTLFKMDPEWSIYAPVDGAIQFLRSAARSFRLVLFAQDDSAVRASLALARWLPELSVSLPSDRPQEEADGSPGREADIAVDFHAMEGAWCVDADLLDAAGGWKGVTMLLKLLRPGSGGGGTAAGCRGRFSGIRRPDGREAGERASRRRVPRRWSQEPVFSEDLQARVLTVLGDKIRSNGLRGRSGATRALREVREIIVPMFDEARVGTMEDGQ